MLFYIIEKFEIKGRLLFDIQPLVMYKGWKAIEFHMFYTLPLEIRNAQSAKSVVIKQSTNADRMQVIYTKCSTDSVSSVSIKQIFSNFGNIHTKFHNCLGNTKAVLN